MQSLTVPVTQTILERIAARELPLRPPRPSRRDYAKSMGTRLASIHAATQHLATPNAVRRASAKRS